MKALPFAAVALLLAAIANAAGITGTVTSDTGAPLASMKVAAYHTDGTLEATVTTNADGTYAMTSILGGQYHVLAYDPTGTFATSFYADAESFETSNVLQLTSILTMSNVNFRLAHAGHAAGRVSDPGGAALSKMTVAAYNLSGTLRGFTTTDAAGNFTLTLPTGSYTIAAYDEALTYAATFFDNAASFDTAAAVTITAPASKSVNLQLPLAAKITGIVTDRVALTPIANARVTAYASDGTIAARGVTGADGRYAVAVRPGGLRVVVDDPTGNYATTYVPDAESFSMEPVVAASVGQTVTVDATMIRGGRLIGRVTDPLTGIALPAVVTAYNLDGTVRAFAMTNTLGYSIVVPPGDYRLGVVDPTFVYLPQFLATPIVHVFEGMTNGGVNFALSKGARITGRVSAAGAPLNTITIGAYELSGNLIASTNSDAEGNYVLLVPPATVKLLAFDNTLHFATAYYLGASTFDATQPLSLIEGQSLSADFAMIEGGRISGIAIAETTFAPLPNIDIIVYDAAFQTIAQATTDSGGSFRIVVPPGSYVLAAADPARRYAPLFYGGGNGALVTISARQDLGPLQFRLAATVTPIRHRAVKR